MARQSAQGRLQPRHNRLLAALPEAEYQALAPALEPLALTPGMALYESGEAQPYLYFPRAGSCRCSICSRTARPPTGVCNRHHSVDQQVCRWLLLALDRLDTAEIAMTQERIAHLLGRRIRVLERAGLEQRACECYAAVRTEYERLLPAPPVTPATAGSRREGRS